MYLARYDPPSGPIVQAGFSLRWPSSRSAAAALTGPVGALADALEARADLGVVVVRGLGRAPGTPLVLVSTRAQDELALRAVLLEWYRLDELAPGCCGWLDDRAAYDAALPPPACCIAVTNRPVARDGVVFHPSYRPHERLEALDLEFLRRGVRATACFRFSRVAVRDAQLAVRQNVVRLGRDWVPARVRAEQAALADTFLAHGLLLEAFVFCAAAGDAPIAFDILARDAAAAGSGATFTDPPIESLDDAAPEYLGIERLAVPPEDEARIGNAAAPGTLRALLEEPLERATAAAALDTAVPTPPEPYRVFISYAHEDRAFADRLRIACAQLRREGWIDDWVDGDLAPGERWRDEIAGRLETADLVLLLVSPDFLASEFCYGIELKRALERQAEGRAVVVPVHVRFADARTAPFAHVQALPTGQRPIASWPDTDEAWLDVVSGLRRTLERAPRLLTARPGGAP